MKSLFQKLELLPIPNDVTVQTLSTNTQYFLLPYFWKNVNSNLLEIKVNNIKLEAKQTSGGENSSWAIKIC